MELKKILVIDDEPDLCRLLKTILESTGMYQVSLAFGGLEGIEKCKKEKPDLIFLDYVMPNVKGDVVIECLRGYGDMKNIPIILMSGLGEMIFFDRIDLGKWIHKYPEEDPNRRPPPAWRQAPGGARLGPSRKAIYPITAWCTDRTLRATW